ncbi:hypothetical protein AXG93_901s1000 [Marchantia polymorpha subsp. ruderalis]|uniref:Uncharacterized protein n=1 Tax=Marchantia polymorpha subsp. ruderalis TaxID=1480154 RepID=A0A176WCH7_MARPO|nr:hypothetical protein AXG93_901s1000 [Marchantia polymorpha subsp. ruderalis]
MGLELVECGDSARVRQWWFTEATGISKKSRDVANLGLEESHGTLRRGMGLLTAEERREFPLQTEAHEGEEVVSANEVNTGPEDESISLAPQRRERPRGRHESRPRKRRETQEVDVS